MAKKIISALIAIIEVALIGLAFYLQDLTGKKAGVNHHLRYKKTYYMNNYFTEGNIKLIVPIFLILALVFMVFLVAKYATKNNSFNFLANFSNNIPGLISLMGVFTSIFAAISWFIPSIADMLVFVYLWFGLAIMTAINLILVIIFTFAPKKVDRK